MKRLLIYVDASVIGGCEDPEFAADSLAPRRSWNMNDSKSPFDAVGWMRAKRNEADEEIRAFGWEEFSRRTLERLEDDPLWCRLRNHVIDPASLLSQIRRDQH
ncbi:MAG: hypothetical protein HY922_00640 [Elusimicrobia bacterium]|nr:hypothetical protein [Elusimicrobiota bacterium]